MFGFQQLRTSITIIHPFKTVRRALFPKQFGLGGWLAALQTKSPLFHYVCQVFTAWLIAPRDSWQFYNLKWKKAPLSLPFFLCFVGGTAAFCLASCSSSGLAWWDLSLSPVCSPHLSSPWVLGLHHERLLGRTSMGSSWAQGQSGKDNTQRGEKKAREKAGRRPGSFAGSQELLQVALPAPSDSNALGLPTRTRGPHPWGSYSNPQCLPPACRRAGVILLHIDLYWVGVLFPLLSL